MKHSILLFVVLAFATACRSGRKQEDYPKTIFTGKFFSRPISLKILLTDEFTVKDLETNQLTTYNVHFHKRTRYSYITEQPNNDTLWIGKVTRGNNIWMLQTPLSDSTYWISGLKVDDKYIYGFNQVRQQMLMIDKKVAEKKLDFLRLNQSDEHPVLSIDRIAIQPHLESILNELPPRYEMVTIGKSNADPRSNHHLGGYIESASYSKSGGFKLELKSSGDFLVEITTNRGFRQVIQASGTRTLETQLENVQGGFLKLRILDAATESQLDEMKLEVTD